ncbi:ROK family protein [Paenibacillus sp. IB182496]|uniref:fructokinase n=1 Tax=Paenibacillus sabuli TaxID=2772509 RepID=A0A927GPT6_9BACL|nr:ROK family protein [Paenibacillus sabuli]MBD2843663.1 ROK family protein [Paenibacillus sabuli]
MRIGAIEAGGTKFVCGIGNEQGTILERVSFPTEGPEETLAQVIAFFKDKEVEAIGIGTFGPIDIDPSSPTYGHVTTTPKPGWTGYDFLGSMKAALPLPYGWDTDVNAAAYGEATWGAAQGLDSCVYYTVGTGIGMGAYSEGKLVHGLVHPEAGHVLVRRHPEDTYEGFCPYHADCLEGLAAGPAIEKRWERKGVDLPPEHEAWRLEAYYLAQAAMTSILLLSPRKVIFGGGVMKQPQLFPLLRQEVLRLLNGYVSAEAVLSGIDSYIVPPGLGDNAGLCGALALGIDAANQAAD